MDGRKVFVIVDGHPTYKARKAKVFVKANDELLRPYFLPPLSLELNPDELLKNDDTSNAIGRQRP